MRAELLYEPIIKQKEFDGHIVMNDLDQFKEISDLIIANRNEKALEDVSYKVFTRDIYSVD